MAGMKQPLFIRAANRAAGALRKRGRFPFPLELDHLREKASRASGHDDFGTATYEIGLRALLEELNSTAALSPLGQIAAYFNLLDYLTVRLNLVAYRKQRREVALQKVAKPLIVLGMPRSGTTILYEMLAQDAAHRSPASWEVAIPVPPPTPGQYHNDRRIRRVDLQFALAEKLSPGFKAIHAIGARLPQECVYLFASHFMSEQFGYMYDVPGYRQSLVNADMSDAYQWHAAFLQHLQVDFAAQRWVLKTPSHLAYLKTLLQQYPDAAIVWTHRAPEETVASFSSLVATLRRGFSDTVDAMKIGDFELQHQARIVERGLAQLPNIPDENIFHVSYRDIVNQPLTVVSDIYDHFEFPLTQESLAQMQQYHERRPQGLYGHHHYTTSQFGIQAGQVDQLFSNYKAAFAEYLR